MICDFIVRYHGGEISVESEVGKGTTFVVALPLQAQPQKFEPSPLVR